MWRVKFSRTDLVRYEALSPKVRGRFVQALREFRRNNPQMTLFLGGVSHKNLKVRQKLGPKLGPNGFIGQGDLPGWRIRIRFSYDGGHYRNRMVWRTSEGTRLEKTWAAAVQRGAKQSEQERAKRRSAWVAGWINS